MRAFLANLYRRLNRRLLPSDIIRHQEMPQRHDFNRKPMIDCPAEYIVDFQGYKYQIYKRKGAFIEGVCLGCKVIPDDISNLDLVDFSKMNLTRNSTSVY
mgnify:CR=1 FL=1|tara:strand:- start:5369 stop:5668 length:300 start_codon:yes stop_codon:yes gene_type:complete